jgi:hypothetical protein
MRFFVILFLVSMLTFSSTRAMQCFTNSSKNSNYIEMNNLLENSNDANDLTVPLISPSISEPVKKVEVRSEFDSDESHGCFSSLRRIFYRMRHKR